MKKQIVEEKSTPTSESSSSLTSSQESTSLIKQVIPFIKNNKHTLIIIVSWGSIVGINWTYGSLFGIIFEGQGLTEKDIALIGLAANLSTAIFSNLGTFIKNRFHISTTKVISLLNLFGFVAGILIQCSKYMTALQDLRILIFLIVILRAGYSSFVSLAFI